MRTIAISRFGRSPGDAAKAAAQFATKVRDERTRGKNILKMLVKGLFGKSETRTSPNRDFAKIEHVTRPLVRVNRLGFEVYHLGFRVYGLVFRV